MLEAKDISFRYSENGIAESNDIFRNLSLTIPEGQFVALLGSNGSGKSTLGKLFNGLLLPTAGEIIVDGLSTLESRNVWEIKRNVGMVFQDPSRQIVAAVVEDDVAFGLENFGLQPSEIRERVDIALERLGISKLRKCEPHYLSGGQTQRVALAGVLAMHPHYLVLDEPTAMLDPQGRRSVLETIKELQNKLGISIIYITHHMDEAVQADRVIVLDKGQIVVDHDSPRQLFSDIASLEQLGLQVPSLFAIAYALKDRLSGKLDYSELSVARLAELIVSSTKAIDKTDSANISKAELVSINASLQDDRGLLPPQQEFGGEAVISLSAVSYTYMVDTPFETSACEDVSLDVLSGECLGIIGATGSGKSTLLQLFNGLLRTTAGTITSFGKVIPSHGGGADLAEVRQKIGFLFQFSEQQLFETTVYNDVAFGPRNLGLAEAEVDTMVREALERVKIPEELWQRSPLALSGGEKRRVALAGVLSCRPQCLVLDEPTVGLDPQGAKALIDLLRFLNRDMRLTIVMISHRYEEVASLATRLAVMAHGRLVAHDSVERILYNHELLKRAGVAGSEVTELLALLHRNNLARDSWPLQAKEAVETCRSLLEPLR